MCPTRTAGLDGPSSCIETIFQTVFRSSNVLYRIVSYRVVPKTEEEPSSCSPPLNPAQPPLALLLPPLSRPLRAPLSSAAPPLAPYGMLRSKYAAKKRNNVLYNMSKCIKPAASIVRNEGGKKCEDEKKSILFQCRSSPPLHPHTTFFLPQPVMPTPEHISKSRKSSLYPTPSTHTHTKHTSGNPLSPAASPLPPSWLSSAASNHGESQSFFLFSPSLPPSSSPSPRSRLCRRPIHTTYACVGRVGVWGPDPIIVGLWCRLRILFFFLFFFPGRASQKELHAGGVPPSLARSKIVRQSKLQYALA